MLELATAALAVVAAVVGGAAIGEAVNEGLTALEGLRAGCSRSELSLRDEAFVAAERFISSSQRWGGVSAPVSRTFQNRNLSRNERSARVDIEVRTGMAFL